jgi:hypothetical protein
MDTIEGYPLMNKKEVDCILSYLDKTKTVFEWGSGNSTIFFAKHCKHIFSVEHDVHWLNLVSDMCLKEDLSNVGVIFQPRKEPHINFTNGYSKLIDDQRSENFENYIKAIDKIKDPETFDFFILDGRARVECAEYCLRRCNENTIVFMQEFYRERYYQALEWYDKIDRVENMAVLKPKKKFLNWTPEVLLSFINGESEDQIIIEQAEKKVSYLMSRFY